MMIYSHARSQIVINGRTITGVDPSADSYSLAPVGDAAHLLAHSVKIFGLNRAKQKKT